jgi:hypothetical protein
MHFPFTHAGTMRSHWTAAGVGQVAQNWAAWGDRLDRKLSAVEIGTARLQMASQALFSCTRVQSALFWHLTVANLSSKEARSPA